MHDEPVPDNAPHSTRRRWRSGEEVWREFSRAQADPGLTAELEDLVGETLEDYDRTLLAE